jgi:hypothetical protein
MIVPAKMFSRAALALSVAVFLLCLSQVGLCIEGRCNAETPSGMLIFGVLEWLNRDAWGAGVAWIANPLLFLSWGAMLMSRYRGAFHFGICALPIALSLLLTRKVVELPVRSDSGLAHAVTAFRLGYWLWVSSMALAALSAALADPSVIKRQYLSSARERHW